MEYRTCTNCGQIFRAFALTKICPKCKIELDKLFVDVRDFIIENERVTITDVAEHFDISKDQVKEWIKEDRIQLDETTGISDLTCKKCGKVIFSGTYCRKYLAEQLASTIQKKPVVVEKEIIKDKEKARMRFLDKK